MINFEKSFTVIISNYIPDKERNKIIKNNNVISFDNTNSVELALAGAYVAYLETQGVKLTQDEFDYLSEKIEKSLKRYKKNTKNKDIIK